MWGKSSHPACDPVCRGWICTYNENNQNNHKSYCQMGDCMFRPIILAAVSAVALSAAAKADGYAPGPRGYGACCQPTIWEGLYIGAYIGGADANMHIRDVDHLNGGARFKIDDESFIWGGQGGYNFQGGNVVFGIEGDIGRTDFNKQKFDPNFPGGTFSGLKGGTVGDVTGRLGVAVDGLPVRSALLYAKGGWAFFDGDVFVDNHKGGFGGGRAFAPTFNGWTLGGGAELKFSRAWSAKIEYLHYDFGTEDATLHTPLNGNFRYRNDLTSDAVKVGLNYHFGEGLFERYVPLK
jgi:outer membrane immunogenic protein